MPPFVTQAPSADTENAAENAVARASPVSAPVFRRLTLKRLLHHPLAGLAIAAHLLLLVIPFNEPKPSDLNDAEAAEKEIDDSIPVDILNLSALSPPPATEPPDSSPPAATPPAPPPSRSLPQIARQLVDSPTDLPPANSPPVTPPVNSPSANQPVADQPPTDQPPLDQPSAQPPAYVAQADQQAFVDNVGALGAGTQGVGNFRDIGLPALDYFSKGNVANFLNYNTNPPSLVPGSIDAVWMDKQANRVAEQIEVTYGANGVTLKQLDDYGDELLYEMFTPNGDTIMYISLVNFPSKGSSLMVSWRTNPLGD